MNANIGLNYKLMDKTINCFLPLNYSYLYHFVDVSIATLCTIMLLKVIIVGILLDLLFIHGFDRVIAVAESDVTSDGLSSSIFYLSSFSIYYIKLKSRLSVCPSVTPISQPCMH